MQNLEEEESVSRSSMEHSGDNKFQKKLYSLVLPCVVAASAAVFGYPYLYRLLVLEQESVRISVSIANMWIPAILAACCVLLYYQKLTFVRKFKKEDTGDYLVIAVWAAIGFAAHFITCELQMSFGTLIALESPASAVEIENHQYVTIEDFQIDHSHTIQHNDHYYHESLFSHSYEEGMVYEAYFIAPLIGGQAHRNDSNTGRPYQLWICVQFEELINGVYPSVGWKVARFYKHVPSQFLQYRTTDIVYFERLTPEDAEYKMFDPVIHLSSGDTVNILLYPHKRLFSERTENSMHKGLFLFVVGVVLIAFPLLWQPLRSKEEVAIDGSGEAECE